MAEARSPQRGVTVWLTTCAVALVLVVGVLAAATDPDGAASATDQAGWSPLTATDWEALAPPPLPPEAAAGGDVRLAEVAGHLLAVADGEGSRPLQVWQLDGDAWSGPSPAPGEPRSHAMVAPTPAELVVWGGVAGLASSNVGFAYDPTDGQWRSVAGSPLPARRDAVGVWTGREVVVVGGVGGDGETAAQTAAYDPTDDSWRLLPNADGLPGASLMAAAWNDGRVVLWAYDEAAREQRLLALDVGNEVWSEVAPPPFPPANGTSDLAGDPGGLVATTTAFDGIAAARLAPSPPAATGLPGTGGWRGLPAPPVTTDVLCPNDLLQGAAGTVLLAGCSGDLSLLDGETWHPLPPLPDAAAGPRAGTAGLVTDDAVYYLAPAGTGTNGAGGAAASLVRLRVR